MYETITFYYFGTKISYLSTAGSMYTGGLTKGVPVCREYIHTIFPSKSKLGKLMLDICNPTSVAHERTPGKAAILFQIEQRKHTITFEVNARS